MHTTPHSVHKLPVRTGVGGLTCELRPSARSAADVQSRKDERDQGQHRHGHRGREIELCEKVFPVSLLSSPSCMTTHIDRRCLQGLNPDLGDRVYRWVLRSACVPELHDGAAAAPLLGACTTCPASRDACALYAHVFALFCHLVYILHDCVRRLPRWPVAYML